jgi:hypothetical protein
VTLAGTYNLLLIGAAVGIIGAAVYQLVRPWLIGPHWFRRLTVGLASAVVVGSMLVHSDGIDFTVLQPTWLAVGLFVMLPACFGVVIGVAVDAVDRPDSWTRKGRRRWVLPLVLVTCFPQLVPIVAVAAAVLAMWTPRASDRTDPAPPGRRPLAARGAHRLVGCRRARSGGAHERYRRACLTRHPARPASP